MLSTGVVRAGQSAWRHMGLGAIVMLRGVDTTISLNGSTAVVLRGPASSPLFDAASMRDEVDVLAAGDSAGGAVSADVAFFTNSPEHTPKPPNLSAALEAGAPRPDDPLGIGGCDESFACSSKYSAP